MDRYKCNDIKDTSSITYKNLIGTKNLNEVWRQRHPNRKQFTYKDVSRLDKFLVSTEVLDNVQKSNILIPGIKSDYKGITLDLDFNKSDKGPGRWTLNISILNDTAYINKIKSLLLKTLVTINISLNNSYGKFAKLK